MAKAEASPRSCPRFRRLLNPAYFWKGAQVAAFSWPSKGDW